MPPLIHKSTATNSRCWLSDHGNLHGRFAENIGFSIFDAMFFRSARMSILARV